MKLIWSDLRIRRRSLMWWMVGVFLTVLLIDAFYPAIAGDQSLDAMMQDIPESLRPLLGPDDLTSPVGYLASQLYLFFLPVIVLVFAIGRGSSAIAGEEEEHTLDLLLTWPVSRTSIYLAKVGAVGLSLTFVVGVSAIPTLLFGPAMQLDIPALNVVAITLQLLVFSALFAALAMTVSSATGRRTLGLAVASALAAVTYLIDGLGQSVEWLENFRPLTPWYWLAATDTLLDGLQLGGVLVLLGSTLAVTLVGMWAFSRRGIRA